MQKVTLTFKTLEGHEEKTRDFYFNLTTADVVKINSALEGGLEGFMKRLHDDPDVNTIYKVFDAIILASYGKKTIEGDFIKTPELTAQFAASDAYSELFLKFWRNEDNFVERFIEGALNVPAEKVNELIAESPEAKVSDAKFTSEF